MEKSRKAIPNTILYEERKLHGWSQRYVAERIQAPSSSYIYRWEKGLASPSPYYQEKLCLLFEKNAQDLGFFSQPKTRQIDIMPPSRQERSDVVPSDETIRYIPYRRNCFFTGREDVLSQIESAFFAHCEASLGPLVALSGMGGIGKTQTALEYTYRFRSRYQTVLWFHAESYTQLAADCMSAAPLLGFHIQKSTNENQAITSVKDWLDKHNGWLLVLDNIEDLALLDAILPLDCQSHLLVTTRLQSLGTAAKRIELPVMDEQEGGLFLLRRTGYLTPQGVLNQVQEKDSRPACKIAQAMGGLPLALDQAGAYIEETGCCISDYLEHYGTRSGVLLERRGDVFFDHPQSIGTTLSLIFEQLQCQHPVAVDLLSFCAFLQPDFIGEDLLSLGASEMEEPLRTVAADGFVLDETLRILRNASLVKRHHETRSLSIHRLVQTWIREMMSEEERHGWIERVIQVVSTIFQDVESTRDWPRYQRHLLHAHTCAQLIRQHHIVSLPADQLLFQVATYCWHQGLSLQAEAFIQQSIRLRTSLFGEKHLRVAESINNRAILQHYCDHYEQAEDLYLQVLHLRQELLGEEHLDVAETLANLAILYTTQQQLKKAEPLHQQALVMRKKLLGEEHPEVARSLYELGRHYILQGRYTEAEELLLRVLALRENALGREHMLTAQTVCQLGNMYSQTGRYAESEKHLMQAAWIYEHALGPEHPYLIVVFQRYTEVLLQMRRDQEAHAVQERIKQIQISHSQKDQLLATVS